MKRLRIPLVLEFDSAPPQVRWVDFDQREVEFAFELDTRPNKVKVDPARNILARFD